MLLRVEELEKRLDALEFGELGAPSGLPLDSPAPGFELPDLEGRSTTLAQFRGQPVLLLFFNPACVFCRELAPKLAADPQTPARLLIVSVGDAETNRQFFSEHQLTCPVLLQKDGEVAAAYQARGTPSAYLISPEGAIASELAMGAEPLLALVNGKETRPTGAQSGDQTAERLARFGNRSLARSKIARNGLKAGTRAPDFRLSKLDGGELSLEDLRGRLVLLVFSDPHCGPCDSLAPQLEKLHRERPELEVVMISRGEPKENRAKVREHGLTFPVVLQQRWEISRRFAMFSTPIAYLIDETGVIAKDVAVGADAIVNLAPRTELLTQENEMADNLMRKGVEAD